MILFRIKIHKGDYSIQLSEAIIEERIVQFGKCMLSGSKEQQINVNKHRITSRKC